MRTKKRGSAKPALKIPEIDLFGERRPREPAEIPEWFDMPEIDQAPPPPRQPGWMSASRRLAVCQVVEGFENGDFALPEWQRAAVWDEGQRIKLLDSIMREIPIGGITMWAPPPSHPHRLVAFSGCPVSEWAQAVVDGQQRLTTILMAARGDLDHWRWNGSKWTTGSGFMLPSWAVARGFHPPSGIRDRGGRAWYRAAERARDHEITFMSLTGSLDSMLTTYERLATCGSPHTVADLEVMREWAARNGAGGAGVGGA